MRESVNEKFRLGLDSRDESEITANSFTINFLKYCGFNLRKKEFDELIKPYALHLGETPHFNLVVKDIYRFMSFIKNRKLPCGQFAGYFCAAKFWCRTSDRCWNTTTFEERIEINNSEAFIKKSQAVKNDIKIENPVKERSATCKVDINIILGSTRKQCFYCDIQLSKLNRTQDHVFPISKGGRADKNKVYACQTCNSFKSSFTFSEWKQLIENKFRNGSVMRSKYNLDQQKALLAKVQFMIENYETKIENNTLQLK